MTTWEATQARIVREASEIRPLKMVVTILAFPFYLIGAVIALVWVLGTLAWQAAWVGVEQTRRSLNQQSERT